jgi:hypothetical protein
VVRSRSSTSSVGTPRIVSSNTVVSARTRRKNRYFAFVTRPFLNPSKISGMMCRIVASTSSGSQAPPLILRIRPASTMMNVIVPIII